MSVHHECAECRACVCEGHDDVAPGVVLVVASGPGQVTRREWVCENHWDVLIGDYYSVRVVAEAEGGAR